MLLLLPALTCLRNTLFTLLDLFTINGTKKNASACLEPLIQIHKLAVENNCKSIAFPLISSGIYGYPKDKALIVATNAIKDFLKEHDIEVSLVLYEK